MTKSKISRLLVIVICLTLLVATLAGCNNNQVDEATLNALNDYFKDSEVEVQRSFGKYNDATVVLVKSQAIENSLRKDTINGIEFKYAKETQLLVVKDSQVYTLKKAYLNLLLDSTVLRDIQPTCNKKIKPYSSATYTEIGNAIVLQEKETMEDHGYVWRGTEIIYIKSDGTEETMKYDKDIFEVYIDHNFNYYRFTVDDFSMFDIQEVRYWTDYADDMYHGNYPETFNHTIKLRLNNVKEEDIPNIIHALLQLDFVKSAIPAILFNFLD